MDRGEHRASYILMQHKNPGDIQAWSANIANMKDKKYPTYTPYLLLWIFLFFFFSSEEICVNWDASSASESEHSSISNVQYGGKRRMKSRPFFCTYKEPHIIQVRVWGSDRSVEMTFATCVKIDSECKKGNEYFKVCQRISAGKRVKVDLWHSGQTESTAENKT